MTVHVFAAAAGTVRTYQPRLGTVSPWQYCLEASGMASSVTLMRSIPGRMAGAPPLEETMLTPVYQNSVPSPTANDFPAGHPCSRDRVSIRQSDGVAPSRILVLPSVVITSPCPSQESSPVPFWMGS